MNGFNDQRYLILKVTGLNLGACKDFSPQNLFKNLHNLQFAYTILATNVRDELLAWHFALLVSDLTWFTKVVEEGHRHMALMDFVQIRSNIELGTINWFGQVTFQENVSLGQSMIPSP